MTQTQHLPLSHHGEYTPIDDIANTLQILLLGGSRNLVLQFVADIEMVGDRAFAATGDQGTVGHTGLNRLLHAVLHQRLVHHRQHFFGHAFGCGQKPGAIAGNREQALTNHAGVSSLP